MSNLPILTASSEKVSGEPWTLAANAQGDLELARAIDSTQPGRAAVLRSEARNKLFKAVKIVAGKRPANRHDAWRLLHKTLGMVAI